MKTAEMGGMGENGGKRGEMGENGKLLQVHHGKCVTMFQQEMKMEENGGNGGDRGERGEMGGNGGKWGKMGNCHKYIMEFV